MNPALEFVIRSVVIGVGATLTMDLWAALLRRFGVQSLNLAYLGRWVGHVPRGRWFHENIARATAIAGERAIGWCAHYAIGISFAALLLVTFGVEWARSPTLLPALAIGVVTVLAPWLILQPAIGLGVASSKTATPMFNALKSLATHVVFGLGMFMTALATAWLSG